MDIEQYYLIKLAEEASEISQIALKTSQFGMDEAYQVLTNKERIHAELNDLLAVVGVLNANYNFGFTPNEEAMKEKIKKMNEYLQYSYDCGKIHAALGE